MRLKYYLRGLGVGVLVTTIILMIASFGKNSMTDEEIIAHARKLGMVMKEEVKDENVKGTTLDNIKDPKTEGPEEQSPEGPGEESDKSPEEPEEGTESPEGTEEGTGESPEGTEEGTGESPEGPEEGTMVSIEVVPGEVSNSVCDKLLAAGLITDKKEYNNYLFEHNKDGLISVGVHQIPMGATFEQITEILCQAP